MTRNRASQLSFSGALPRVTVRGLHESVGIVRRGRVTQWRSCTALVRLDDEHEPRELAIDEIDEIE